LKGGHRKRRPGAKHKGKGEEEGGRHPVRQRQKGEGQPREGQHALDGNEDPTPVERIGKNPSDVREEQVRQCIRCLDQRDQEGGVWLADQQLLRSHGLHPGADVAPEGLQPQGAEDPEAERCPRRRSRTGSSHQAVRTVQRFTEVPGSIRHIRRSDRRLIPVLRPADV
jgi:hypothetical protein